MLIQHPINLLPKQTTAWDLLEDPQSLVDELGYGGGAGGGKTNFGCKLAIFLADTFPGSRGAICRFELKNLKRTTLASFFEVATELGLKQKQKGVKYWDYDYNQQDGKITFNNADKQRDIPPSEILILDTAPSPKDPLYTRLGGLELSWEWVDESNETPAKAIEILGTRVGRRNYRPEWEENLKKYFGRYDEESHRWILRPISLETFNPEKGHIYQRFWKPFKEGTMPTYRAFVRALASDNPFLPRAYIQAILRKGKATIERLLHGNFDYDDDPTKIFIYDKILDIFSNTHVPGKLPVMEKGEQKFDEEGEPMFKRGERFLIGDVAGKGKDKTVLYVWEGFRVIAIYWEPWTDQRLLRIKVQELKEKYSIPLSNILLDYDGIGVGIVDELQCKGFQNNANAVTSQEEKEQDLKANYKNLRSQCWFKLADFVNDNLIYIECADEEVKLMITEELDVIKEINEGSEKKKAIIPKGGSGKEDENKVTIKSLLGRSPDFGDGLMMRMWFEVAAETTPGIDWL
jgi:phage terminase large subunit